MNLHTLAEIRAEMARADALHKADYPDGTNPTLMPLAASFRALCDAKADTKTVTWADVLAEECAEAISEPDATRLRAELVQVAAVAIRWIRSLDARSLLDVPKQLVKLTGGELRELYTACEIARSRGKDNLEFRMQVLSEVEKRKRSK